MGFGGTLLTLLSYCSLAAVMSEGIGKSSVFYGRCLGAFKQDRPRKKDSFERDKTKTQGLLEGLSCPLQNLEILTILLSSSQPPETNHLSMQHCCLEKLNLDLLELGLRLGSRAY